jgi:hypothetical protein
LRTNFGFYGDKKSHFRGTNIGFVRLRGVEAKTDTYPFLILVPAVVEAVGAVEAQQRAALAVRGHGAGLGLGLVARQREQEQDRADRGHRSVHELACVRV